MEITFVWSWFSFIVGSVSAIVAAFLLVLVFAFKQWKKQKEAARAQTDSVEKLFSSWGGRDNSAL
jgi:high-affinity Fe2+/Pb2+ permease